MKLHLVQFAQQIVGKLDISLVNFIDQYDGRHIGFESLPQHALADVVGNVPYPFVTQLGIAQTRYGIVFI